MKKAVLARSLLAAALGIGLVIGLFYLTGISFSALADLVARLNWPDFAGIVLCSFLYVVLGGIKWHLIAGAPAPRAFFYLHHTAQAMLIGQFLPVPVAIAVNHAAVMKLKQNTAIKKGLLNAVYDMGFDFLIAAILIPASLLQLFYGFSFGFWLAFGIAAVFASCIFLMFAPKLAPPRWLAKTGLTEQRRQGLLSPRIIGLMMLLSTARFVVVIARLILGAAALGIAVPFAVIAYATPPATMSALLALTPANLGIAEWSWAYLLTLWGVPAALGALYGVSFRIIVFAAQVIVSGACWGLYATGKPRIKK